MRALRSAVLLVLCLAASSPAWAIFELTAEPRRGGRDLRFDTGLSSQPVREEELTLTVDTDQAVPYRIYMTFLSPFTNEQGKTLPQDALYFFSPTNALGQLRTKLESPLTLGQTMLYSSNSAGDSDRFTLVFHLNLPSDLPGGVYRSSLSFTLEPSTPVAGLTPRTVTLELRAEAKPAFRLAVRSEKGAERLDLGRINKKGEAPKPAVLNFQIESNVGQPYRIFQELRGALTSDTGQTLPEQAIQFSTEAVSSGRAAAGGSLEAAPGLLFESEPAGGNAQFRAVYRTEFSPTLPAGRFSGMLFLRVESASPYAAGQSTQLPVVFEIEPVFNLDIHIPDGFGLQFGNLRAGQVAPEKVVLLTVHSNMRQPYQVSQVVLRRMTTPDGAALPEEAFQYSVQRTATGTVEAIGARPVQMGESLLFLSDSIGTPEVITATYFLTVPSEAKSGPYGTEIKYSITTL